MSDLMKVGSDWGGGGTFKPFTSTISGSQRVSDAHGRYVDAVLQNRCFRLATTGATPTAYVGAAGGTPLLALHNPANSNKYAALLMVGLSGRAQGSAAGQTGLDVWSGPSVIPTGTQTTPRNMLSGEVGGSGMVGFVNTALTGSTALTFQLGLWTYYWATAAAAVQSPGLFDIGGIILVPPGNEIAIGLTTVITSATYDLSMIWEELPFNVVA